MGGMIVLFTDFGTDADGPYVGQMTQRLHDEGGAAPFINLFHGVPPFDVEAGSHLLAAYGQDMAAGAVVLAVVDPGVGGARKPLMVRAGDRWFVGPDNGLFEIPLRRREEDGLADWQAWEITWRPAGELSASFHGRDLFAPVAARLSRGVAPETLGRPIEGGAIRRPDWPGEVGRILHIDGYGNAVTGLRVRSLDLDAAITLKGVEIRRKRTFSEGGGGEAFWYENASGLVEIAVNQASAASALGLAPGVQLVVTKV